MRSEEKLRYIFEQLKKGVEREELSEKMGYKNYNSFKNFIRAKGYYWEKEGKRYVKGKKRQAPEIKIDDSFRAKRVLMYFQDENAEPKEVAKKLDFDNYKDMSNFMKMKGYLWSSKESNFVKKEEYLNRNLEELKNLDKYIELLELLTKNYGNLEEALNLNSGKIIKKYRIPGVNTIKSVQIISSLNEMAREYSRAFNITQKNIFEVALIEFFQKYGFEREIKYLLGEETEKANNIGV